MRRSGRRSADPLKRAIAIAGLAMTILISRGTSAAGSPASIGINGLDAHDGMVQQVGGTYYLYGTRYGCGFIWGVQGPFCGFGVWQSTDKVTWTFVRLLFDPQSIDPYRNMTWVDDCGMNGCFNPRMIQRGDGVWILWFNSPQDYLWNHSNAYYAMGCDGPAGPCGPGAGPHGSVHKPSLSVCYDNGDFSVYAENGTAYLYCTMTDQTLRVEQLDIWWTNGIGVGGKLAIQGNAETPGVYRDPPTGYAVATYSRPNCAFCATGGVDYAVAAWPLGPFVDAPKRLPLQAGQPRSVSIIDGHAYEWWDLWLGCCGNQAAANIELVPLSGLPPE